MNGTTTPSREARQFAIEEYISVWKEAGVEDLPRSASLENFFGRMAEAPKTDLMFVRGGSPAQEASSALLAKIIEAMGFAPADVHVMHLSELSGTLRQQIEMVNPKIIIALGPDATQALLDRSEPFESRRGQFHPLEWDPHIEVIPTFEPAYLLDHPEAKRLVWEDMKQVKTKLGVPT